MTPERFARLRRALVRRQPDLTVVLEGVHKPHNLAAVLRTCDAVGVFAVHAVAPEREVVPVDAFVSSGTGKWVRVSTHDTLPTALDAVRSGGLRCVAAHPDPAVVDFREVDFTRPTALLLGQEKDGLTPAALAAADDLVRIPMLGLGRSLNVSVAAALILFEAQRQRTRAGLYDESRLDPELFRATLFEWAHPHAARHCRTLGAAYPALDDDGELAEPLPRSG